ncbi:MAG: LysE family transporter [Armatimonadetes bacterium]|nr:LysE family transporter [Armatimonadota bacterium]
MVELLTISFTWWAVSLSGVLMPGPISAMAVSEGARRGFVAGPLITAGHAVSELLMLVALAVGMNHLLQRPAVAGVVGLLGGVVLAWMGWGIVEAARRAALSPGTAAGPGGTATAGMELVRAGILTTLGNPYWLLWWVTVGASYYVLFSRFGVVALVLLFFVGHIALDLGWTSLLAFVVGAGRGRIPAGVYRAVLGVCGVFVIAMSAYFLISGLRFLTQR